LHFRSAYSDKFKQAHIWKLANIKNTTNEPNQGLKLYVLIGNVQESSIKLGLVPKIILVDFKTLSQGTNNKQINK
jgi:hypothetical protein